MTTFDDSLAILLQAHPEQHPHQAGGARGASVAGPAPGSPLHGDDLVVAPFSVSGYTHGLLAHATVLLDTWLLGKAGGAQAADPLGVEPQIWATSLRDALDVAANALWILSPGERRTRVTRRLDLALRESLEIGRIQRYTGLPTEKADESVRRVAAVANEHGLRVTGHVPARAVLDAAAGHSTARNRLPEVRALLDAAAHGDPDAVESLSRIPVRLPRSSTADTFAPSPSLGFRVALAAITSVVLYGEALYDAGRKAPR